MLTATHFGRFQSPDPLTARLTLHRGEPLREVDHEPKLAVLDQQDLFAQGIHVSTFIPNAQDVDALGSCTANATTAHLSTVISSFPTAVAPFDDAHAGEVFAIKFYHGCSDLTGDSAEEWPPTDCGSSGPYIYSYAKALGLISDQQIAHGPQNLVALLQTNSVLMGSPFLNAWETPDSSGFIDGDGTVSTLESQLNQGVAGGHETVLCAVEKLTLTETGVVDPFNTVLRARNSWSASWGDHGDYRVHLSTLSVLGQYIDFRQFTAS